MRKKKLQAFQTLINDLKPVETFEPGLFIRRLMLAYFEHPALQQELFLLILDEANRQPGTYHNLSTHPTRINLQDEAELLTIPTGHNTFPLSYIKSFFTHVENLRAILPAWRTTDRADQQAAKEKTQQLIKTAQTLAFLHALYHISQCYVNKHKRPKADQKIGLKNSRSWQHIFGEIRHAALEKLFAHAETFNMAFLQKADTLQLFNSHRNNYFFTGAIGKTSAKKHIHSTIKAISSARLLQDLLHETVLDARTYANIKTIFMNLLFTEANTYSADYLYFDKDCENVFAFGNIYYYENTFIFRKTPEKSSEFLAESLIINCGDTLLAINSFFKNKLQEKYNPKIESFFEIFIEQLRKNIATPNWLTATFPQQVRDLFSNIESYMQIPEPKTPPFRFHLFAAPAKPSITTGPRPTTITIKRSHS